MDTTPVFVRRHLKLGWWLLLVFLSLGIALELMHGLKAGFYLSVANDTRRLMWRLAHAHGVLLAVVHLAFAASLRLGSTGDPGWRRNASRLLTAAALFLPGGFFLGGVVVHEGDPFVGVFLVPVGAICLFLAVLLTAWNVGQRDGGDAT
jgi:hypothetical protein